jgi:RNA polymerase sigma-70 factor (ECF subfamily)
VQYFSAERILWAGTNVLEAGGRIIGGPGAEASGMADGSLEPVTLNQLMTAMRPRLHRYCARMVGSAFDGEDVVQDALAKAAEAWPGDTDIAKPEQWLFRIAHNTALDALRRRRRGGVALAADGVEREADMTAAADARVIASGGLAELLRLPIAQRACVVLVDVLGHSLAETAEILDITLAAVKAALHRGRARLKSAGTATHEIPPTAIDPDERRRLFAYADRFNAREFDALRDLLADEVRLDLVDRIRLAGRKDVAVYFTRYSGSSDWRLQPGLAEGRPALLVSDPADPSGAVAYVVLIGWAGDRITGIRDFRYATYIVDGLAATPL